MKFAGWSIAAIALIAGIVFFMWAQKEPLSAADKKLLDAAHTNDLAMLRAAIAEGANVNARVQVKPWDKWFGEPNAEEGYTALHYVAQFGNVEAAKLLVEKGADVNAVNVLDNTPLMFAAGYLGKDLVVYLLAHRADPNIKNHWGSTAFNFSVKRNGSVLGDEIGAIIKAAGGIAGTGSEQGAPSGGG